jgi:ribosomal protein S18 acetylase RimI-like enzyme
MTDAPDLVERPATRADLQAVTDLYCAYEQAVRGAPDTDPGDVSADWDVPGFDLDTGTRVLELDGRVVGYAVRLDEEADSVIDLDLRDRGLEDRLLRWLEAAGTPLEHYVPDTDPPLGALLAGRGWAPARRFWRMRRDLDTPSPEPVWPADVQVHDLVRPDDERPVHALVQAAFAEIGGQHERTFEQWSAFLLESDRFDPSLCPVVTVAGEPVGVALGQATSDYGFVRQLAVAPSHRGRGLALALLHECFRRHRDRGLPATVLGVDAANPTGALALYAKAGMRVVEQFTRWERPAAD